MLKEDKILHIGCGSSRLSGELSDDGYELITNLDFSPIVIEQNIERYRQKYPKMDFKTMDVLNMQELQPQFFNAVLDKGTFDCIMFGENFQQNIETMMNEIKRVLVPGGEFICVSHGDEEHRRKYFEQYWGNLNVEKIENEGGKAHFVYIMGD